MKRNYKVCEQCKVHSKVSQGTNIKINQKWFDKYKKANIEHLCDEFSWEDEFKQTVPLYCKFKLEHTILNEKNN